MGQAKRKGTFEERKALALVRDEQNAVQKHAEWQAKQQQRAEKLAAMPEDLRYKAIMAETNRKQGMLKLVAASAALAGSAMSHL